MRPIIISNIGGPYRLHNKHEQTWHYKIYSQFHLFYHATFSSLFQCVLWLVTINCRHKHISIFFIMMTAFLFSPLLENVINLIYSTKHSPSFPILSFHISKDFEIIVNNRKLCETPWEPCSGTVWNTLGTPRPKKFSNPLVNLYPPEEQQSDKLFSIIQKRPLHHRLLEDFFLSWGLRKV